MRRTASLIVGTAVVAALLVWLVTVMRWPAWVGVVLVLGVFGVLGLAMAAARPPAPLALDPLPPPAVAPPPPPPPPPPVQVQAVPLPSADPDYRFLLYGTVCWRVRAGSTGPLPPNPDELARRLVVDRAAQVTAHEDPGRYDLVQHRLAQILGTVTPDRTGSIEVWAHGVALTLPQEDLERQYRLSSLRKNEQVWEHERNYERNLRGYLQGEVFGDAGSAVLWWLAQDTKQVRQTTELIGTFAQLAAAANNQEVDPVFRHLVAGQPAEQPVPVQVPRGRVEVGAAGVAATADAMFGTDGDSPERALFADHVARVVRDLGDDELATRIRVDFDAPDLEAPAATDGGDAPDPAVDPTPDPAPEPPGRHVMPDPASHAYAPDPVSNTPNGR